MRKTLERCNKAIKRLGGNEGFSLVELIIVVAIMVALVAVLAPQYFQYVEKSRKSVDVTTADSILSAAKVISIDPDFYDVAASGDFTVTWNCSETSDEDDFGDIVCSVSGLSDALEAAVGENVIPKSNFAKTTAGNFVVTVAVADGQFTFSVNGDAAAETPADPTNDWASVMGVPAT